MPADPKMLRGTPPRTSRGLLRLHLGSLGILVRFPNLVSGPFLVPGGHIGGQKLSPMRLFGDSATGISKKSVATRAARSDFTIAIRVWCLAV